MISTMKLFIATALVSYLSLCTLASPTICYNGAGSYNDPYDCRNYIVCESDGNGGYDISLKRCPDVEVFDMDDPEGCIMPTQEDLDRLCNFAY